MKKQLLIVLTIMNAAAIAWAQCHDPESMGPRMERKEIRIHKMEPGGHDCSMMAGPGRGQWWENPLMVKELGLSESQSKQIDDLVLKHRKAVIKLEADIKIAEMDLANLIEDGASETDIRKKSKELSQLREKMHDLRIDHLLAMRKVLTADQQKKLRELRITRHGLMDDDKPMPHMPNR